MTRSSSMSIETPHPFAGVARTCRSSFGVWATGMRMARCCLPCKAELGVLMRCGAEPSRALVRRSLVADLQVGVVGCAPG